MSTSLSHQIEESLPRARSSYHKLLLAVGPTRSGKTLALVDLGQRHSWPRLNVNLHLSQLLLELTQRQRAVRVAGLLSDIIREQKSEPILLDNIELLFADQLAQDPLRLLQSVARNRVIVAAWPGNFDGICLTYGEPSHGEARRYQAPQVVIVRAADTYRAKVESPAEEQE